MIVRSEYDQMLISLIASDFALKHSSFLTTNKNIAFRLISMLDSDHMKLDECLVYIKDAKIDIGEWKQYLSDIVSPVTVTVKRHTDSEDMIYKTEIEIGAKYLMCSVKEDHVMNYEFMVGFSKKKVNKITCPYCTNPVDKNIYEQI